MKKFTKRQLQVLYYFSQHSGLEKDTYTIDSISYSRRSGLWEVWYLSNRTGLLNYMITKNFQEWM